MAVQQTITEFLDQVSIRHGEEYRNRMDVRHAGGGDIVITTPTGDKSVTSLGNLQLMTETMRRNSAAMPAA